MHYVSTTNRFSRLTAPDYNNYETSYTSYGAGGGAGGGGFIPGEGGSTQSPGGRRDFAQDSLRPVTIKQLLDAQGEAGSNDNFKIDGTVLSQVRRRLDVWGTCANSMASSHSSAKYAIYPTRLQTPHIVSTTAPEA